MTDWGSRPPIAALRTKGSKGPKALPQSVQANVRFADWQLGTCHSAPVSVVHSRRSDCRIPAPPIKDPPIFPSPPRQRTAWDTVPQPSGGSEF